MSSTYTIRFRLNIQAPGDNLNAWGSVLNSGVFQLLEDAIGKRVAITTAANTYTLSTANGSTDEARCAYLDVTTGTGLTLTIPSVEKLYFVRNGASGSVVVTTGAGTTATLIPAEIGAVVCDGTNVRKAVLTDFGGAKLTSVADPTNPQDAATKAYADALAFTANAGILPGQVGATGKALFANFGGAGVAGWKQITSTDLGDFTTNILGIQVALAVAL